MPNRWCGHRCESRWLAEHVVDRGAERNSASPIVFDQDSSPGGCPRHKSQQGDLNQRSFINHSPGASRLEEGTCTGSGRRSGGCGSISLGNTVGAEMESEGCLFRAAGLSGTEVSAGRVVEGMRRRGNQTRKEIVGSRYWRNGVVLVVFVAVLGVRVVRMW